MVQDSEENNTINWSSEVRHLLFRYGFGEIWINQGTENEAGFIQAFVQRLRDNYQQDFYAKLNNSSKALLYRNLATCFDTPYYIEIVKSTKYRHAITKLRTCNHRLTSETGRWNRPPIPYHERKCVVCNKLDDEYHFVLECTKYSALRFKYIKRYYYNHPSMEKFLELLSCRKQKVLYNLGIYLYKAFKMEF